MRRWISGSLVVVFVSTMVLLSCAPKAAPITSPTPAPLTQPAPALVAQTAAPAPAVSPEDEAWAKVVVAARKEGSVTVYSYGWRGDIGIEIARAFQQRYGIKLEIITGRGAEFVERLKTEQRSGKMVADLFEGSTVHAVNMKNASLSIASTDLPVLKDSSVFVASPLNPDPQGHVLLYDVYIYSPYINTNLVKPGEEPKTWKYLLNPKWKGKMMVGSPAVSMDVYMQFWPLKAAGVVDMDYLRALARQDIFLTLGTGDSTQRLSRGDGALSIMGTPTEMSGPIINGAPIRAIPMEPAMTAAGGNSLVANKGGPHPNATKVLINWMFRDCHEINVLS